MKEKSFIEKLPNWLRYIIAIPISIIGTIIVLFFINFSSILFSDTNSLWYFIITFVSANFLSILVFFFCLNYTLPKYEFTFTLIISILICCLIMFLLILTILTNTLNLKYIIGLLLSVISCIISCIFSKKGSFNQV